MRKPFLQTLTKLAQQDPRVILIIGDVGFSFVEEYKKNFPNQFLNCGVMEQTMIGMAAGMARMGWKPYVYTMKNFILLRPLEQLRNDICYSEANVKLIGVGGSAAYRFLGYSHNLAEGEEEKILSTLPNIKCYAPKNDEECTNIIEKSYQEAGPAYIAL